MSNYRKPILKLICHFVKHPMQLAFLMSAALLGGAYAFEYIGGLTPCDLCWSQRYALMAVFGLSGASLLLEKAGQALSIVMAWATGLALGVSVFAAGYHTGVEQKWWKGPDTCTSDGLTGALDMDSMFDNLMNVALVRCDEIAWEMFGISMSGYNFLISLGVSLFVTYALVKTLRKNNGKTIS